MFVRIVPTPYWPVSRWWYIYTFVVSDVGRDMITAAIGDADSSVRATARRAYWVLRLRFPDLAESVMGSLAPSMQVGKAAARVGCLTYGRSLFCVFLFFK